MIAVKESKSYGGYKIINDVPKEVMYFRFICDTVSDLPSLDVYDSLDILLGEGCDAEVIDPKSDYRMKSDGTWVIQDVGNDYYSKSEIDDMIDEINDTDDMQDRAISDLYAENTNEQLQIDYAINTGVKNLLRTRRASGTSTTGLTYTLNADGTYNLGGTTTAAANITAICTLADLDEYWVGKQVTLSGAVNSDIRLAVYNGNTLTDIVDSGSGVDFIITQEMITNPYTIRLLVASGTDCAGKVLKPMLRYKYISDGTYQPYAVSNKELYDSVENYTILRGSELRPTSANPIDLNDLLTAGRYYVSSSDSPYATHKPDDNVTAGFQLTIAENQLENRFVETFTYNNASYVGKIYKRWYTASGWSSWYLFEGTAV